MASLLGYRPYNALCRRLKSEWWERHRGYSGRYLACLFL